MSFVSERWVAAHIGGHSLVAMFIAGRQVFFPAGPPTRPAGLFFPESPFRYPRGANVTRPTPSTFNLTFTWGSAAQLETSRVELFGPDGTKISDHSGTANSGNDPFWPNIQYFGSADVAVPSTVTIPTPNEDVQFLLRQTGSGWDNKTGIGVSRAHIYVQQPLLFQNVTFSKQSVSGHTSGVNVTFTGDVHGYPKPNVLVYNEAVPDANVRHVGDRHWRFTYTRFFSAGNYTVTVAATNNSQTTGALYSTAPAVNLTVSSP